MTPAGELRVGIHSGQQHSDFPGYLDLWATAERMGFDWASVFDHFLPIRSDPTGPCFEGMTLLAAMAAHTRRIRIGMIVLGVTYRHPALVANMAATIDHVSGGRLELGYGAAWYALEHDQYGMPFPPIGERMDMLEEACRIVRLLWSEERTTFSGRYYRLREARCEPKPLQQHLPLIVGGSGERRTLRIVAEHADGWNMLYAPIEEYRHKVEVLERHCADVGRDPAAIRRQLLVPMLLGADEAEADERLRERAAALGRDVAELRRELVVATPEQLVETLRPHLALGVRDVLMMARPPGDRRTMQLLVEEAAPALRERARADARWR